MKRDLNLWASYLFAAFFLFSFSNCTKKIEDTKVAVSGVAGIPAFPLNWEVGDYMPTPTGTTILVPWANGSVKGFTSDIWYDFLSADGWELVYNVFNTTALPDNPFFVLYNKYRGLVRIYVYVNTGSFTTSSYVTSGLNLAPNAINSSLLNYVSQDIVDVSSPQTVSTKIEPTQIASGVWYASQYEMAYDPNISSSTYQQLGLNWTLKWTNISQVDLGGTLVGSLKGTITTAGSSFNLGGNLQQGVINALGVTTINDAAGPNSSAPENNNLLGVPPFVYKSIKDAVTGNFSGVIKNLLNGVLGKGGTGPSAQAVNATINSQIKLTGSITNSGAVFPDPGLGLGVPGTSNSASAAGYIPLYNQPMGVVNVSTKPSILSHKYTFTLRGQPAHGWVYSIDPASYSVLINPAVSSVATVTIDKQEIIMIEPPFVPQSTNGLLETVGSKNIYSNVTQYAIRGTVSSHSLCPLAIRVTLTVTPNNGSNPMTIVKTFLANEIPN